MNPSLRLAIDNAKKENVPNSNIEKAIKRGTGELKGENQFEYISYEGYGPAGVAIIVECLSDNRNRTYTNIRTIFSKKGGNLGGPGAVAWMFNRYGVISVKTDDTSKEAVELAAIDAGAEDIKYDGQMMEVCVQPSYLHQVAEKLKNQNIKIEKAEILFVPKNTVKIENESDAKKVLEFIDAFEEDQDVTDVASNFDISDELMGKIYN